MTTAEEEKKFSILNEILVGTGAVSYQYRLRKRLEAFPEETIFQRIDKTRRASSNEETYQLADDLAKKGIHWVTIYDEEYPDLLRQITDPPVVLFYSGDLNVLDSPCISIIGARACTTYGIQTTRHITSELVKMGFTIVSGLALGIDGIAHQASLESEGRTAAVLGSGIKVIYPRQHTELAREIVKTRGIVMTEFAPEDVPKPHHFPMRNRIISGLSRATIVIEAEKKSGTLITAQFCLDQGRELFAVPGPLNQPTSSGTHQLISNSEAHIFTSVEDFLNQIETLPEIVKTSEKNKKVEINDPLLQTIYDSLDAFTPSNFDDLMATLGPENALTPGELGAKLVQLDNLGLLTILPGLKYLKNALNHSGETPV